MASEFYLDAEVIEPLDRYRQGTVALVMLADGRELQAFVPTWRLARGDRVRGRYRNARRYATPVEPDRVEVHPGRSDAVQRELGQAVLNALPAFGYRRAVKLGAMGEAAYGYLCGELDIAPLFDPAEGALLRQAREQLREWHWYFSRLRELQALGFTPLEAATALEELGAAALDLARQDPFLLVQSRGVRYHQLMARRGCPSELGALLEEIKNHTLSFGDTLVPLAELPLPERELQAGLRQAAGHLYAQGPFAALPRVRALELGILDAVAGRSALPELRPPPGLSAEQAAAFRLLGARVAALTGGPGTGKTFTVSRLVQAAQAAGVEVTLIAPTGKAAQRMQELSGREAQTIHRALGINPNQPFTPAQTLPRGLVVLDEASMVGLEEMARVLDALPEGACLLLVGDADQLPPVSPGAPFVDLLDHVPTVRLSVVRRQAGESGIARAARAVLAGQPLRDLLEERPQDLLYQAGDAESLAQALGDTVAWYHRQGLSPKDLQVLTPVHGGLLGTRNLNRLLREVLKPPRRGRALELSDGTTAYEGEKIIFGENQPHWGVMNGTVGIVADVGEDTFALETAAGLLTLPRHLARLASQGYAVTVHRSQGSEWPVVVLVLPKSPLTQRKLVYTGITRARLQAVLLSEVDLADASVPIERRRHTYLRHYLSQLRERGERLSPRPAPSPAP